MPLEEEKHPSEVLETYKSTSNLSVQELSVKPFKEIDEFEDLGENLGFDKWKIQQISRKGKSKKSKVMKLLSKLKKKKQLMKRKGNET